MSANHPSSQPGHENQDFTAKYAVWVIPASLAILVLFVITISFLAAGAASREMTAKQVEGAQAGRALLSGVRAHEDSLLESYGRDTSGHIRIPIRRAMEILAGKGSKTP